MRVIVSFAVLGLAGCNLVFGLEPPGGGGAIDGNDGDDGDGGGDFDATAEPCTGAPLFCARFATGLTDDGFRTPSLFGSAAIYHATEAPQFARVLLDEATNPAKAVLEAPLSAAGAEHYVVSFLLRGGMACGAGGTSTTPITLFQFNIPSSAISVFVRRTGANLEIGGGGLVVGNSALVVGVDLSDRFHRIDIDVDFPENKLGFAIDGNSSASFELAQDPGLDHPPTVIVGLEAAGNQPDCQMDYDDVVVSIR